MNSLPETLRRVVATNAERTALVCGDTTLTYAALEKRVAGLAAHLASEGARPGDRIGLLLPNSPDFVIGYFAILALGAIVVPLNEHYEQRELVSLLNECGVSILVTSREFQPLSENVLPMCDTRCRPFFMQDQNAKAEASTNDLSVEINAQSPAMYQFSSGSTGHPKRIARTHANLLFELDALIGTLGLSSADRFIGVAPFSHVNGLMRSMLASMRAGATLYPMAKFERNAVAEVIEKNRLTVFIGVPFMFSTLAQTNFSRRPDFSSLRYCISASAPMPVKFNRLFQEKFGMYVRQLYGSTETGSISVNLHPVTESTLDSVGTPIPGVSVEVFREDGRVALPEEMGEFAVSSPAAITRYEGVGDMNDAFRDGLFFTGDLGRKDADGMLYLIGRKKFFINKAGYKIDPHEVEEILESHPNVREAVVVGVPTPYGDEKVKAVVVLSEPCTGAELAEFCRGKIAAFKIPSVIEFRDHLPTAPTGKVRRTMLV